MKHLFFFLFGLLSLTAHADSFENYLREKEQNVSHKQHLPYILSHGHKTQVSVLFIHGIFSSPFYFRQVAESFYKKGYNVVTILLPGHWGKDIYDMKSTTSNSWSAEADRGYEFARTLGDRVILAGHSLGGLLSIEQAIKRPASEVVGVFLMSPALAIKPVVLTACRAGKQFRLDGNTFTLSKPDGKNIPWFAPRAALLIQELYLRVKYLDLNVPMYLAYTWNDPVVRVNTLKTFKYDVQTHNKKVRIYSLTSGVAHANIGQGSQDHPTYPVAAANWDFDNMMIEGMSFLAQF